MTGLVRKAMFLAVLGLLAASAAFAGVPSCANSTFPTFVDLVGCTTGPVPDPGYGTFTVTVRDIGNFPVVNQVVSAYFKSDVATYDSDNCVSATTDALGVATFKVAGAGRNSNGGASFTGAGAVRFFFGNCATTGWCATANVCVFDENGYVVTKGVEITDLSAWGADFVIGAVRPRSDFNHNNSNDIVDGSTLGGCYVVGKSALSCGTLFLNGIW
jgi:hypothetical protein